MKPKITLLDEDLISRVILEAFELLQKPGIKVQNEDARALLFKAGAKVDESTQVVRLPHSLILGCLATVPHHFHLYDYFGEPKVHYGGEAVHFDPGSSGINIFDSDTRQHREAQAQDLLRIVKVTESISQYDAQSTSVFCSDVPNSIQDLYRLYLVLLHSSKPIVTGALSNKNIQNMIDMLALVSDGAENLRRYPRAVFDVCPSPPLMWSNFGGGNLIALARAGVPAEMVSVPLAGAAAPVTLIGAVTQHTAECLAGLTIHQLAGPGSPLVWGGAPTIFEMRKGGAPMGAIETSLLNSACAQVGKSLHLPTHGYLGGSDSKLVDVQAGLESSQAILVGALSGINMISGAGMIDSLLCVSPEKLVIDAESIAMARRFLRGIATPTDTLATGFYAGVDFKGGDFLKQRITIDLFQKEQYLTGPVIDRDSMRGWQDAGSLDTFARAKVQVNKLVSSYKRPLMDSTHEETLHSFVLSLARAAGLDELPSLD
jgi:trimethylamine--corrinoid protein Co-methyltransferase